MSRASIFFGARTEIPGFYRPEKEWDLLVVIDGVLRVAIELKSQVGPSFGNNANNRIEEALGSAIDARRASSAGLLGAANGQPWLGYLFLLEDATGSRRKVRPAESHFPVDPIFKSSSYVERYAALCRRLEREGVYSATCLLLSPRAKTGAYSEPAPDLGIVRFLRSLRDHSLGHGVTSRLSSRQNQLQ